MNTRYNTLNEEPNVRSKLMVLQCITDHANGQLDQQCNYKLTTTRTGYIQGLHLEYIHNNVKEDRTTGPPPNEPHKCFILEQFKDDTKMMTDWWHRGKGGSAYKHRRTDVAELSDMKQSYFLQKDNSQQSARTTIIYSIIQCISIQLTDSLSSLPKRCK